VFEIMKREITKRTAIITNAITVMPCLIATSFFARF
jgi:hypothetical protein